MFPMASGNFDVSTDGPINYQRSKVSYENLCDPFIMKEKQFNAQYYPFYLSRLNTLRPLVRKAAEHKWGSNVKFIKMSEIAELADQKVVIIGVLFKNMANQPTVLKEISSEDNQLVPQAPRDCYIDDDDYLILQDDKECVKLHGDIDVHSHVTGIVIGLYGHAGSEGRDFIVHDFCYPMLPNPRETLPFEEDKYILILSGLGFSRSSNPQLDSALNLLTDYLSGLLDVGDCQKSAKIVRLIVAGNLIGENVREEEEKNDETLGKPWLKKSKPFSVEIMIKVDNFLAELGKTIGLEIMPGYTDTTSQLLPQQPLHPSILPNSSVLADVRSVTNPYSALFDSRLLIGTSGQPVDNIRKFSNLADSIEIMEKTILESHLAPTAPDTLYGYFNPKGDPFVLTQLPDVYFAGNQSKFATKLKKMNNQHHIRFICVPKFETTYSGVLLNLKDLSCELVTFA